MENPNLGVVATSPVFDFEAPPATFLNGAAGDGPMDRAMIEKEMTLIKALLLRPRDTISISTLIFADVFVVIRSE